MNKGISRKFYVINWELLTNDIQDGLSEIGESGFYYFSTYTYSDADVETELADDGEIQELQEMWNNGNRDLMDEIELNSIYIEQMED
jgi:hypothetical protein